MKSSKKRTEKTFVPFTLSIEVESEEEEELLNAIFNANITIPDILKKNGRIKATQVYRLEDMFGRLVETMSKATP